MSGPDPHLPPDDRELEDFLAGRGAHRARYRQASSERAPESLDAVVLAQAVAATTLRPKVVTGLAWSRWRLPLSLAATLVIGVGLSLRVQREAPLPPLADGGASMQESASVAEAPVATGDAVMADGAAAPVVATAPRAAAGPKPLAPERSLAKTPEPIDPGAREAAVAKTLERRQATTPLVEAERAQSVVTAPPPPPPPPPAPPVAGIYPEPVMAASAAPAIPQAADRAAPAAATMAAPRAEARSRGRADLATASGSSSVFSAGEYRSASGSRLELLAEGHFRLERGELELEGRRETAADGELLLPLGEGAPDCVLHLGPGTGPDALRLQGRCPAEEWVEVYRPATP